MSMLPKVRPSSALYGTSHPELFGGEIPVSGAAGDQQAALFGQGCFECGDVKNTYGTGCFMLMNTGDRPVPSKNGLVSTVAWSLSEGEAVYALEGSVFVAGAVVQWLRDEMRLISSSAESETVAKSVPDTNGCYFVPAFTGMGAPYWDQDARGIITGLTRGTGRAHIVRAALESIAYQSCDVLFSMEKDLGRKIQALRVDGGASANNFLMQFQSGVAGIDVIRPASVETTALGAAFLAGLSVGFWRDRDELLALCMGDGARVFSPDIGKEERDTLLSGWHNAVKKCRG
jgi:glycerol kinase